MDLCHKVMSLLFKTLSRLVTPFLPRSNYLLISIIIGKCNSKMTPRYYITHTRKAIIKKCVIVIHRNSPIMLVAL